MKFIRIFPIAFLVIIICIYIFPDKNYAASNEPMSVFVNGNQVLFTMPPIVEKGNTLVQLRPIYENIGIEIQWDEKTRTITSTKNEWIIKMTIDSKEATIDGEKVIIPIAPRIVDGNTFVPLRFVGESLDGEVTWDKSTNRVDIISDPGYYVYLGAQSNDLEEVTVRLGLYGGANFMNKYYGRTALSFAIDHKNREMMELLLKYGADPNHSLSRTDNLGPLASIILSKDPTLVQLLVDYGANISFEDKESNAVDYAKNILLEESNEIDKTKLKQIITILETAIQKDKLLLAEDETLIPFNVSKKVNIISGGLGNWGYFDHAGNIAINPRFSIAVPFSEGLAFAEKDGRNRSGYIEKNGKFKFTFDFTPTLIPGDFKEGLAPVGKDKKWGFIDNTGSFIISPKYEDALSFSQGVAAVKKNGKWGLINHAGEVVLEPKYEWIFPFHDGLALVHGEHSGFINPKGELVIDFHALGISEYGEFSEGYASVTKDGKRGVIDSQGQFIIPPTYTHISEFHEGLAAASVDEKYGFIDTTGKLIIAMQYDLTYPFRNGQALVKKGGKWSFINVKGELVGLTSYDTVDSVMGTSILSSIYPPFSDKANAMAMLHKGDQTFYVLPNGEIIPY